MVTLKPVVLPHQKKVDGTFNVKIRITFKRLSRYISTPIFVVKQQLSKQRTVMMKFIFFTCIMFLVVSCNTNIETKKNATDSLESAKAQNEIDSIKKLEKYKSTSNIAFGKVTFGLTEKEYDKLSLPYFNEIAGSKYRFQPEFNSSGNLFKLNISGFSRTANYIDGELNEEMKALARLISKKYDSPSFYEPISFRKFNPGYIQWFAIWDLGDKMIKLGMLEISSGSKYNVELCIYNKEMERLNRIEVEKSQTKADDKNLDKF